MSTEEQQAAIGRTVEEYAASKKKLAALQSDAGKISNSLYEIVQALRASNRQGASSVGALGAIINKEVSNLPTTDSLIALAQNIKTEMERKEQLHVLLKNMGSSRRTEPCRV